MKIPRPPRWLIVDDDALLLEATVAALSGVPDVELVACDNPQLALEVFFAEPESFELMVTDFNMPGMDGLELARTIHERAPQMPVVMVTGSDLAGASAPRDELRALLPKPCAPGALLAVALAALPKICLV